MMKKIKIISPATVANISCGFDIIGLALNTPNDEMIVSENINSDINIKSISGADLSYNPNKNVVGIALKAMLKEYYKNNIIKKIGFKIEIHKKILPGSGIGSSAASSAGIVFGVNKLLGNPFKKIDLIRFAMEGERLSGGVAHADNVAPAIMGGLTLIRSYNPLDIISINVPKNLWVTIIHPQIEIKTSDARSILKKKISMKNAIKQWGNIAALITGFYKEDYDLISRSLEDFIVEPIRSILIPNFEELKVKCKEVGALGGGISGSGPSVFMFSKGKQIAVLASKVMSNIYSNIGIDYKIYISSINLNGISCIEINR